MHRCKVDDIEETNAGMRDRNTKRNGGNNSKWIGMWAWIPAYVTPGIICIVFFWLSFSGFAAG